MALVTASISSISRSRTAIVAAVRKGATGANLNPNEREYTHAVVIRFPTLEALNIFRDSSEYKNAWRSAAFGVCGFMHFTKSGFQKHSENFRTEEMQEQLEGKICIVTGANSGIGFATAEGLASRGSATV